MSEEHSKGGCGCLTAILVVILIIIAWKVLRNFDTIFLKKTATVTVVEEMK